MKRKIISLALAFIMVFSLLPLSAFAATELTTATVTAKAQAYIDKLGITTKDKATWYWNAEKSDTELKNEAKKGNYTACLTKKGCNHGTKCKSNSFGKAIECAGFAHYMIYVTMGLTPGSLLLAHEQNTTPKGWTHYNNYQIKSGFKFHPGDYLRIEGSYPGSHSIFIYKVTSKNVYYIDCNYDGKCGVEIHSSTVSEMRSLVQAEGAYMFRYNNLGSSPVMVAGYCAEYDSYAEYVTDYIANCTRYYTHGKVKLKKATTAKSIPSSTNKKSENVKSYRADTTLTVNAIYKNSNGKYWYRITVGGRYAYIYCGDTTWQSLKKDAKITDGKYPKSVKKGNSFGIGGKLTTTNKLATVGAYVYKGTATSGTAKISSKQTDIGKTSYKLAGSTVDSKLKFGKLAAGSYNYVIKVKYNYCYSNNGTALVKKTSNAYIVHQNTFTVK